MCVCVPVKREDIKQILTELMNRIDKFGRYSKKDVEIAIMICRGSDPRTIRNWWRYLWQLEYFIQPEPGVYKMNLDKIAGLELPLPVQIDPNQRRLLDKP